MADLAPPLAMFLREYLPRDRVTSRHTVESYVLCFKLLVVFAADKHGIRPCTLEIGHLDIGTLLEFLEHLERDRGNGVRTRNARLAAIKTFFRKCCAQHLRNNVKRIVMLNRVSPALF